MPDDKREPITLDVHNLVVEHRADNVTLTQIHNLVVQSAVHAATVQFVDRKEN